MKDKIKNIVQILAALGYYLIGIIITISLFIVWMISEFYPQYFEKHIPFIWHLFGSD